jgi:hypothetical protein
LSEGIAIPDASESIYLGLSGSLVIITLNHFNKSFDRCMRL